MNITEKSRSADDSVRPVLYRDHHRMALFISLALSLMVIPVLWLIAQFALGYLWYSYLIAYVIEALLIVFFHRMGRLKFELKTV